MAAISAGEFERIFKEFYKPLCLFALRFTAVSYTHLTLPTIA